MISNKFYLSLACVSAFLVATSTGTHAATLVQTRTFSVQSELFDLSFDEFNTTLGTLTSVDVSISYTRSGGHVDLDNEGATTATVNFSHTTNVFVDSDNMILDWSNISGGTRLLASASTRTVSTQNGITLGPDSDGAADYSGADSFRYNLQNITSTSSGTFFNISQFEGAGTYAVPVFVSQSTSVTGAGAVVQQIVPAQIDGSMTITYNYEAAAPPPIPEPNALLLGSAAALLLFRRHRRIIKIE